MEQSNKSSEPHWYPQPPAPPSALQELMSASGLDLPQEYLSFLAFSNGGDGDLSVQPWWFSLWTAEEVVGSNQDYEVQQWLPGFFGIGGNGGGEMLAFDTRTAQPWKIYTVPFIGSGEQDALLVADSFADFIKATAVILPDNQ